MGKKYSALGNKEKIQLAGGFLLAAGSLLLTLYYILLPARTTFYADCSDTLYWANASYQSGRLFSSDFYYATLQPFGGMLLMLPFISLFGFSLKTHLIGMALFALVFAAGTWFFCTALELSLPRRLVLFSSIMLLLSSSAKLRELMWEHVIYYSLGMLFSMIFLGLCFRLYRRWQDPVPTKKRLLMALLVIFSALVATDGAQVMVFCTVPVAGALLLQHFLDPKATLKTPQVRQSLYITGLMAGGTLAGTLLLKLLQGDIRTSYSDQHMVFGPSANWAENIMKLPDFWVRLVGFNPQDGQKILTLGSLGELIRLAFAGLLVLIPLIALIRYRHIANKQLRLLLLYHGILSAILLFSHIAGTTANAHWRFSPVVFSSVLVSVLYLMECWKLPDAKRFIALCAAVLCLTGALNAVQMLRVPTRNGQNQIFYALVHELEENGLSQGYADFQVSQPLTVLSDNRIQARYVLFDEEGAHPFPYQTQMNWYASNPELDRYFIVIETAQLESFAQSPSWQALQGAAVETRVLEPYQILIFAENPIQA